MYLDALGLVSDAQALSGAATTASTNAIDLTALSSGARDLGDGEPLVMAIGIDVAADLADGNETYQFDFIQSVNANLSSPTVLESRVISRTLLTVGTLHYVPVPPGAITARYIGMQYVLGGTTPSITMTTWLTLMSMIQRFRAYPKGYVVN